MTTFNQGHALVIAIANYPRVRKLPETVLNDGRDMYNLLCSPSCGYSADNIRLLLDGQATKKNICDDLIWLGSEAKANSTVLIFFSGHGGRLEINSQTQRCLIPYNIALDNIEETAIPGKEFTDLIGNIQAQRLVIFFDCCYSGGIGNPKSLSSQQVVFKSFDSNYYEQLANGTGRVIMASSRSDEVSLVLQGMTNSLFTNHLMEAFTGQTRTRGDGLIRVFDIFDHISEAIPAHASQHPIFKSADLENNFPIALYKGGTKSSKGLPRTAINKQRLREVMVEVFNLQELAILCANVQQSLTDDGIRFRVDLDMGGGEMKEYKILALIEYLDRPGHLPYLVQAVRHYRPGVI